LTARSGAKFFNLAQGSSILQATVYQTTTQKDENYKTMTIRHAQDQTRLRTLHTETVSHKYRSNTTMDSTSQAIGGRRLSWSTEVFQRTPRLHQTHLLWEPSSRLNGNGCLFSGEASSLDAFSSYPQQRGCPATALSDNRLTRGYSVPFLSY
jgi:hypothetical protein